MLETTPGITSQLASDGTPLQSFQPAVLKALGIALALVLLTRLPVARAWPMDSDEFGFVEQIRAHRFPMHHTLFLALGRSLGLMAGDAYRGFIVLDIIMSALALVSAWWWLRAIVSPPTAAAGAVVLGCGPVFWGYGAMAGNYTAIVAVGSFLLGVAYRTRRNPAAWHPIAAAVVLAFGTGYRQDIGTLWLPVFVVILWQHRWKRAILAGVAFHGAESRLAAADARRSRRLDAVSRRERRVRLQRGLSELGMEPRSGRRSGPVRRQAGDGTCSGRSARACSSCREDCPGSSVKRTAAFSPACSPSASSPRSARTCWSISACRATRFTMSPRCSPSRSWGSDVRRRTPRRSGALACSICSISPPLGWPRSPSSWPASSCSTPPIMISRAGVGTSTYRSPGTQGSDCGRLCPTASPRSGGRPTRGSWRERASAGGADPHRRSETEGSARLLPSGMAARHARR